MVIDVTAAREDDLDKSINYRVYKAGDEDQIFDLTNVVWASTYLIPEKAKWLEGWKWMFLSNPSGPSVFWVAEHDGKIISEFPLIMMDISANHKRIKAAQLADTMAHPNYRRRGHTIELAHRSLGQLKECNVHLAFGFPSKMAYALHMKSGWIDVCAINLMFMPLNFQNLLRIYFTNNKIILSICSKIGYLALKMTTRKLSCAKEISVSEIFSFDYSFNTLCDTLSNDYNIIVIKDKDYLNWRYANAPTGKYIIFKAERNSKICGYMVLECKNINDLFFGCILDLVAPIGQNDIVCILISKAIEYFKRRNVDIIISNIVSNRYFYEFLKMGFLPYLKNRDRFIAYNASSEFSDQYLKNPKNWFIQYGDLPLVF